MKTDLGDSGKLRRKFESLRQNGAVFIELLIVAPLLLLFVAAVINFGAILSQHQHIITSLRVGARVAALQNASSSISCSTLISTAQSRASQDLESRSPPPGGRWSITGASVLQTALDPSINPPQQMIQVVGAADHEDNCIFCWPGFPLRITPQASFTVLLPRGCS